MNDTASLLFDLRVIAVPIFSSEQLFPIRRIYCIGRNYAAHAREMGSDPERDPPFFFQKPRDAVQYAAPGTVLDHAYPTLTNNYHHEVELVAVLQKGGSNIPAAEALDCIFGYAVGLDMTRRDLQRAMGDAKKPWEIGKAFDHAAPIGPIVPASRTGHLKAGRIALSVNGKIRQQDDLSSMSWGVAEQIAKLSEAFRLEAGDIIFSGTPENVGPVLRGDVLAGEIEGLPDLSIRIV
jgi:2-keto-4-pentenoate hydratase/2-oxohepta-3-ene-1,7-dioic acid hydratase in catechol pathway